MLQTGLLVNWNMMEDLGRKPLFVGLNLLCEMYLVYGAMWKTESLPDRDIFYCLPV